MSKLADVGMPETPTPLALANVGNGDTPSPPKTCRRLKWMVPNGQLNRQSKEYCGEEMVFFKFFL